MTYEWMLRFLLQFKNKYCLLLDWSVGQSHVLVFAVAEDAFYLSIRECEQVTRGV